MFCSMCGNEVPEGMAFCPSCGAAQGGAEAQVPVNDAMQTQQQNPAAMQQQNPAGYQQGAPYSTAGADDNYKGLGIAGMVCGIAGVVLIWFTFIIGIIVAIVGCALSGLSISKAKGRPNGMGIAGLVCSIVALAIGIPACICTVACASSVYNTGSAFYSMFY